MPTMVGLHGWLQLVVVVVVKGMGMDGSCMSHSRVRWTLTVDRRPIHSSWRHASVAPRRVRNGVVERDGVVAPGGFEEHCAARMSVKVADGKTGAAADVARHCTPADGKHY